MYLGGAVTSVVCQLKILSNRGQHEHVGKELICSLVIGILVEINSALWCIRKLAGYCHQITKAKAELTYSCKRLGRLTARSRMKIDQDINSSLQG